MIKEGVCKMWAIPMICGFAEGTSMIADGPSVDVFVISRISRIFCGARYWSRGSDQEGNTAIEAESILVCTKGDLIVSMCMLRGSIPLRWTQDQIKDPLSDPPIELDASEASDSCCANHFDMLDLYRCRSITVFDMVQRGVKSRNTKLLSEKYNAVIHSVASSVEYVALTDSLISERLLRRQLESQAAKVGFSSAHVDKDIVFPIRHQKSLARFNSIDCVDEATLAQYIVAEQCLKGMMKELKVWLPTRNSLPTSVEKLLRKIWADHGDALSCYYVGTCMRDQTMRRTVVSFLLGAVYPAYIDLCRSYLSKLALHRKQDVRDFIMGTSSFPLKPKMVEVKEQFPTVRADQPKKYDHVGPIVPKTEDYIYLRKSLQRTEQLKPFPWNFLYMIRRLTAPHKINNILQFCLAMIWSFIYLVLVKVLKFEMNDFSSKPKTQINVKELTNIFSVIRGLGIMY
jgi:SacI homology domain